MRSDLAAFVLRARYERASDRRRINTSGTLPIGQVHLETEASRPACRNWSTLERSSRITRQLGASASSQPRSLSLSLSLSFNSEAEAIRNARHRGELNSSLRTLSRDKARDYFRRGTFSGRDRQRRARHASKPSVPPTFFLFPSSFFLVFFFLFFPCTIKATLRQLSRSASRARMIFGGSRSRAAEVPKEDRRTSGLYDQFHHGAAPNS